MSQKGGRLPFLGDHWASAVHSFAVLRRSVCLGLQNGEKYTHQTEGRRFDPCIAHQEACANRRDFPCPNPASSNGSVVAWEAPSGLISPRPSAGSHKTG